MKRLIIFIIGGVYTFNLFGQLAIQPLQPNVIWGGRTVGITIHPVNSNEVIAASANGGLFKSTDGGNTWRHLDNLPVFSMMDVKYNPTFHDKVIATCLLDTDTTLKIGIWLSNDRGETWFQRDGLLPVPDRSSRTRYNKRFSAYGISFDYNGVAYVGTDYGIAVGKAGHNNWSHVIHDNTMPVASDKLQNAVFSVKAFHSAKLVIGARSGVYYNRDMYVSTPFIRSSSTVVFADGTVNGIAQSPYNERDFILAPNLNEIYVSGDTAKTLTAAVMPVFGRVSRVPVVAIAKNPDNADLIDVYVHRVVMWKKTINKNELSRLPGSWVNANVEHDDMAACGLHQGLLKFITGDGGIFKKEGDRWVSTSRGSSGYNALEAYQVWGQRVVSGAPVVTMRTDYYVGTQDNNLWSSSDGGSTWPFDGGVEGAGFDGPRVVVSSTARNVVSINNSSGENQFSGPNFSSLISWRDPGLPRGNPKYAGGGYYVQFFIDTLTGDFNIMQTPDNGSSWVRVGTINGYRLWQGEKVSQDSSFTMYIPYTRRLPFTNGFSNIGLMRLQKKYSTDGRVLYYYMRNMDTVSTMGSLMLYPAEFSWPVVYGFDYNDSYKLLAPDVESKVMKWSYDAGASWKADLNLTRLITENGKYIFYESPGNFSVWTISFNPSNSRQIAIGTRNSGIVYTSNGGLTWCRVPNSKKIPHITSIWWDFDGTALVSSFGRGVWRFNPAMMTTSTENCVSNLLTIKVRDYLRPIADIPLSIKNNAISALPEVREIGIAKLPVKPFNSFEKLNPVVTLITKNIRFGEMVVGEDGKATIFGSGFSPSAPAFIEQDEKIIFQNIPVMKDGTIKYHFLFKRAPGIYKLAVSQNINGQKTSGDFFIKIPNIDMPSKKLTITPTKILKN